MKKIILILLTTTLFSCQVFKKSTKEKSKEETKTEIEVKVDSVAEVEIEQEITSTFVSDSTAEILDLSTETTKIVFNDSGVVKEIITTKKNNIKSKVKNIDNNKIIKNKNILSKIDLSKVDKSNESKSKSELVKVKEVKKWSLPTWMWITIGITFFLFILVAVWKIKKKYFPLR